LTNSALFYRIESMKMETVIRSPQDGVIKKLAHKEGVSNLVVDAVLQIGRIERFLITANNTIGHLQGWHCACII
jgi:hypothetical protein